MYVNFACVAWPVAGIWLFLLLAMVAGGVIAFKLGYKSGLKPKGE